MNKLSIIPGAKIYINGCSNTIELTVTSVRRKFATFDNPEYRYLLEYDAVEFLSGSNKGAYTQGFETAEAAEQYLESKLQEMGF